MEEQKIDVTHFQDFACPKCGSKLLKEAVIIKQIPKFVFGNAEIAYAPAQVIACAECKEVLFAVPSQTMLVAPFKPFLQN